MEKARPMLKGVMRILQRDSTRNVLSRLVKILEQNSPRKVSFGFVRIRDEITIFIPIKLNFFFKTNFVAGSAVGAYTGIYASQNYNVRFTIQYFDVF